MKFARSLSHHVCAFCENFLPGSSLIEIEKLQTAANYVLALPIPYGGCSLCVYFDSTERLSMFYHCAESEI